MIYLTSFEKENLINKLNHRIDIYKFIISKNNKYLFLVDC